MILSDQGVRQALANRQIQIDPEPADDQYTTSAVDFTLGSDFYEWDRDKLSVKGVRVELNLAEHEFHSTARAYMVKCAVENDGSFVLPPYSQDSRLLLATTREKVHLEPGSLLAARVEGRSSLARLGLMVQLTAPIVHAGFKGNITLEIINLGPFYLRLVPTKTRICQLVFERLESEPSSAWPSSSRRCVSSERPSAKVTCPGPRCGRQSRSQPPRRRTNGFKNAGKCPTGRSSGT